MSRTASESILSLRRPGGSRVDWPLPAAGLTSFVTRLQAEGTAITVNVTRVGAADRCPYALVSRDGGCHALDLVLP